MTKRITKENTKRDKQVWIMAGSNEWYKYVTKIEIAVVLETFTVSFVFTIHYIIKFVPNLEKMSFIMPF